MCVCIYSKKSRYEWYKKISVGLKFGVNILFGFIIVLFHYSY